MTGPNGLNDTFAYNGLGQRVAKTDSTGTYALVSDGASPAADVLADGAAVYTPGLSSRKGSSSEFRHGDLLGSLRFLTDANQNVVANRLFSAFGSTVASSGDPSTPFGWVGDGESQTDADTGLVLMGHRLYDDRIGRFLSQYPAGDGDNWYAYADNDPVDETDPTGLDAAPTPGVWSTNGGAFSDDAAAAAGFGYSGSSGTPIYNAIFTAVKGTNEIVDCFITGLAGTIGGSSVNVVTYSGFTPQEAKKITHILNVINTTKRGHQLVSKLRKPGRKYKIVKNSKGEADAPHGIVYFSFDTNATFDNLNGTFPATPTRILAHELGHIVGGEPTDGGPDNMSNVNANENPVMLELENGDIAALRTDYH